jgi:hypothetical protein
MSDPATSRAIREHVQAARRELQAAHKLACQSAFGVGDMAPLRVRFGLARAQKILARIIEALPLGNDFTDR